MKKNLNTTFSKTFIFLFLSGFYAIVSAQGSHSNSFGCMSMNNMNTWFGVLELPFLVHMHVLCL